MSSSLSVIWSTLYTSSSSSASTSSSYTSSSLTCNKAAFQRLRLDATEIGVYAFGFCDGFPLLARLSMATGEIVSSKLGGFSSTIRDTELDPTQRPFGALAVDPVSRDVFVSYQAPSDIWVAERCVWNLTACSAFNTTSLPTDFAWSNVGGAALLLPASMRLANGSWLVYTTAVPGSSRISSTVAVDDLTGRFFVCGYDTSTNPQNAFIQSGSLATGYVNQLISLSVSPATAQRLLVDEFVVDSNGGIIYLLVNSYDMTDDSLAKSNVLWSVGLNGQSFGSQSNADKYLDAAVTINSISSKRNVIAVAGSILTTQFGAATPIRYPALRVYQKGYPIDQIEPSIGLSAAGGSRVVLSLSSWKYSLNQRNLASSSSAIIPVFQANGRNFTDCRLLDEDRSIWNCSAPAGNGLDIPVYAIMGNDSVHASAWISYEPPKLISANASIAYFIGGSVIFVATNTGGWMSDMSVRLVSPSFAMIPCTGIQYLGASTFQCFVSSSLQPREPYRVALSVNGNSASEVLTISSSSYPLYSIAPRTCTAAQGPMEVTISTVSIPESFRPVKALVSGGGLVLSTTMLGNGTIFKLVLADFEQTGVEVDVQLVAGSGLRSEAIKFGVAPPRIFSVWPSSSDNNGSFSTTQSTPMWISGLNFGVPPLFIGGSANYLANITVGGSRTACVDIVRWNDTTLSCMLEPGVGSNLTVVFNRTGVIARGGRVDYRPPKVTDVSPKKGDPSSTLQLTFTGQEFGTSAKDVKLVVFVNETRLPMEQTTSSCTLTSQQPNYSSVDCTLNIRSQPVNDHLSLGLNVGGQESNRVFFRNTLVSLFAPFTYNVDAIGFQNRPVNVSLLWSDADEPVTMSFEVVQQSPHGVVSLSASLTDAILLNGRFASSLIVFIPKRSFHGLTSWQYRAVDGPFKSNVSTVSIRIDHVNQPPTLVSNTTVAMESESKLKIKLVAEDLEDTLLQYKITALPARGRLSTATSDILTVPYILTNSSSTADVFFTSLTDYGAAYASFAWTACDSEGLCLDTDASVAIKVTPINHPPRAISANFSATESIVSSICLNATDADGDLVKKTIKSYPYHGTMTNGGAPIELNVEIPDCLDYTPIEYFFGTDNFTWTAADGQSQTVSTAFIHVDNVNNPPQFLTESVKLYFDGSDEFEVVLEAADYDEEASLRAVIDVNGSSILPASLKYGAKTVTSGSVIDMIPVSPGIYRATLMLSDEETGGHRPYARIVYKVYDTYDFPTAKPQTIDIGVNCGTQYNCLWKSQGPMCCGCPAGGFCDMKGDFFPKNLKGYYPDLNQTTEEPQLTFLPCPDVEACPDDNFIAKDMASFGNWTYTCGDGYRGSRCGQCQSGYWRSGLTCKKCENTQVPTFVIVGGVVVAALVLLLVMNLIRKVGSFLDCRGIVSSPST